MTEKELIKNIQLLKEIKPNKEWAFSTKSRILREAPQKTFFLPSFLFSPRYRLAFAPVLSIFILIGLFGFSQISLPGDFLFSLKKASESGRAIFVSEADMSKYQLEQANSRLEDLVKIAEQNQVKKIAPAVDEFQKTLSQAAKNLKDNPNIGKEIIDQAKKIVENKEKVEKLGVVISGTDELDNTLRELVEREINDLGNRTLTESQTRLLEEAKTSFEAGNFAQALEEIWQITQSASK